MARMKRLLDVVPETTSHQMIRQLEYELVELRRRLELGDNGISSWGNSGSARSYSVSDRIVEIENKLQILKG